MNEPSEVMRALYRGERDEAERLARGRELDVHEAAALGDAARVHVLAGADPASVHAWSADGGQPLHFAAFFGQAETARMLTGLGADVNAKAGGFGGVSPLHSAAAANSTEIARDLLDAGADPNARQQGGFTALHAAAQNRNGELRVLLLERGADPSARTDDGRDADSFA